MVGLLLAIIETTMSIIAIIKFSALFLITLVATIIDTVAGGGGLLVVPAMLLYGLTPPWPWNQ